MVQSLVYKEVLGSFGPKSSEAIRENLLTGFAAQDTENLSGWRVLGRILAIFKRS